MIIAVICILLSFKVFLSFISALILYISAGSAWRCLEGNSGTGLICCYRYHDYLAFIFFNFWKFSLIWKHIKAFDVWESEYAKITESGEKFIIVWKWKKKKTENKASGRSSRCFSQRIKGIKTSDIFQKLTYSKREKFSIQNCSFVYA